MDHAKPLMISPQDLLRRIATPDGPRIFDVCLPEDHAADPRIIPAAQRLTHAEAAQLNTSNAVIVCQKGFKLSQGVAAILRSRGQSAWALDGGMIAWAKTGMPLWPASLHPRLGQWGLRWVLPLQPDPVDLLSAWIVYRFVDPDAIWLQVAPDQCMAVADRFDAALPQDLSDALKTVTGPLQARLTALELHVSKPDIQMLLHAHTTRGGTIADSAVIFDALWAAGEPS